MSEHVYRHKPVCDDLRRAANSVEPSKRFTRTHMEDIGIAKERDALKGSDDKAFVQALVLNTLG